MFMPRYVIAARISMFVIRLYYEPMVIESIKGQQDNGRRNNDLKPAHAPRADPEIERCDGAPTTAAITATTSNRDFYLLFVVTQYIGM